MFGVLCSRWERRHPASFFRKPQRGEHGLGGAKDEGQGPRLDPRHVSEGAYDNAGFFAKPIVPLEMASIVDHEPNFQGWPYGIPAKTQKQS